jgi:hypothetical protein
MMGRQVVDQSQLFYLFNLEEYRINRAPLGGAKFRSGWLLLDFSEERSKPIGQRLC